MSDFYNVLSRVYQEVTPVVPVRKASRRRTKADQGQLLFAEPAALAYQQVLPGVFAKGVETSGRALPCLWFVDSAKPVALLGMTHDFAGATFKWPVYQVPILLGDGASLNLEPKLVETYQKRESLRLPAQIDKSIQTLIAALVEHAVPSNVVHGFIDATRVWAIEDYLSAAYRLKLKAALSALVESVYELKLGQENQQNVVTMIQEIKKHISKFQKSGSEAIIDSEIFCAVLEGTLGGTMPAVLSSSLSAFMAQPAHYHNTLETPSDSTAPSFAELVEKTNVPEAFLINRYYLSFIEAQLR